MNGPIGAIALAIIGYLIGAIPVGLVVGRAVGRVDIRTTGSGRTGATNTLRSLGLRWAAVVFTLDVAKGILPVLLARALYQAGPPGSPIVVYAAVGLAAVIGHDWSVYIGFTGGRGVATAAGALLALAPLTMLVLAPVTAGIVAWSRYVSLGSMVAALLAIPTSAVLTAMDLADPAAVVFSIGAAALILFAHRDNIARLRAGTERRIGVREGARANEHG